MKVSASKVPKVLVMQNAIFRYIVIIGALLRVSVYLLGRF